MYPVSSRMLMNPFLSVSAARPRASSKISVKAPLRHLGSSRDFSVLRELDEPAVPGEQVDVVIAPSGQTAGRDEIARGCHRNCVDLAHIAEPGRHARGCQGLAQVAVERPEPDRLIPRAGHGQPSGPVHIGAPDRRRGYPRVQHQHRSGIEPGRLGIRHW
jgi:hypothetical protein